MSITDGEFRSLKEGWDDRTLEILDERARTNYARDRLEHFTEREAVAMRGALARLIPQTEEIDLVGFIDGRMWDALGRGDRRPGMPDEIEVLKSGLFGLDEAAEHLHRMTFSELGGEEQDAILRLVQENKAPGGSWTKVPGDYFFQRLYARALTGYYSHPKVWQRIGFYGPSYPEGYLWLSRADVGQRHKRAPGWEKM